MSGGALRQETTREKKGSFCRGREEALSKERPGFAGRRATLDLHLLRQNPSVHLLPEGVEEVRVFSQEGEPDGAEALGERRKAGAPKEKKELEFVLSFALFLFRW